MKRKVGNFLAVTSEYYGVIEAAFIVGYIAMIVVSNQIPIAIPLSVIVINCFLFLFYKDYVKSQKTAFMIFRLGICISAVMITVFLLNALGRFFNKTLPLPVYFLICTTVFLIVTIGLFLDNSKKEKSIENIRVKNQFGGAKGQENDNYDVMFCHNKQTNQEVWMKTMDRYLHAFVLGPTGCGKTSLIITPMLVQDMQKDCGTIVIDPKGHLSNKVYEIGKHYGKDVIYFKSIMPD